MKSGIMKTIENTESITKECHADLREISFWFGGWDELRKVIDTLEAEDIEASAERAQERKYEGDGHFADNH